MESKEEHVRKPLYAIQMAIVNRVAQSWEPKEMEQSGGPATSSKYASMMVRADMLVRISISVIFWRGIEWKLLLLIYNH